MLNVSFSGIKENIAIGNQALNSLKQDFPNGLKSSTYYETFSPNVDKQTLDSYQDLINQTRDIVEFKLRQGKTKQAAVIDAVNITGAGNCGEQAILVSKKLDDLGVDNKIISMDICTQKTPHNPRDGHNFCIIDTAKDMNIKDPNTWGENAVIVDLWTNTVAKAKEALDYFGTFLVPRKNECIHFIKVDKN